MSFERIKKTLAGFFSMKTSRKADSVQMLLVIIIVILVNIAGSTINFRIDLTRDRSYSLTARSRAMVKGLNERLKVIVLFSDNLPADHARVFHYLRDLLEEYSLYGSRYFSYEIVSQNDLKKRAADYGIRPVTSQELVSDQVNFRNTYMALVIQHADLMEKIDAVTDSAGLEYEISSRIEKMKAKVDALTEMRQKNSSISVTLYCDPALKKLPVQGMANLDAVIAQAVKKANSRNYDRLAFRVIDPAKAGAEGIAERYGLNRITWQGGRGADGTVIEPGTGDMGLVVSWKDRHVTLPVRIVTNILGQSAVSGLENIDELINGAVSVILVPGRKVAYLAGRGTADIADDRNPQGGTILNQILSDGYTLENVDLSKNDIGHDTNLLIVNGPRQTISEIEQYRIDQFLLRGNSVIFLVDSFTEVQLPGNNSMFGAQPMAVPVNDGVKELLAGWGIRVNADIVLDKNAPRVNLGHAIGEYYLAPKIMRSGLDKSSPVTAGLPGLALLKVSSLSWDAEKLREKGITVTPLVKTSRESWTMTGRVDFNQALMAPPETSAMKEHTVALLAEGNFTSRFAGRDVPHMGDAGPHKVKAAPIISNARLDSTVKGAVSRIIVVGTSEIGRSRFILDSRKILAGSGNPGGVNFPNSLFIHNMVDYLTGNAHVPAMRGKSLAFNPLDKTDPGARLIVKALNIAGVPFMVIMWGVVMWRARIAYRKRIETAYLAKGESES